MDYLPDHILVQIFSNFSNAPKNLLSVRQVCRRWRNLADFAEESLWKNVEIAVFYHNQSENDAPVRKLDESSVIAMKCLRVSRFVGSLTLKLSQATCNKFIHQISSLRPNGSNLHTLKLYLVREAICSKQLHSLLLLFAKLKHLEFFFVDGTYTTPLQLRYVPNLQSLRVQGCNAGFQLDGPVDTRPSLQELGFFYSEDLCSDREGDLLRCSQEILKKLTFVVRSNLDILPEKLLHVKFKSLIVLQLILTIGASCSLQAHNYSFPITRAMESFSSITELNLVFNKHCLWYVVQLLKNAPSNIRILFLFQRGCVNYSCSHDNKVWNGKASDMMKAAFKRSKHLIQFEAIFCSKFIDTAEINLLKERFPHIKSKIINKTCWCAI